MYPEVLDNMYPEDFSGLGNLKPAYHMQRESANVIPVVHVPRKIPLVLQDNLKHRLKRMQADG